MLLLRRFLQKYRAIGVTSFLAGILIPYLALSAETHLDKRIEDLARQFQNSCDERRRELRTDFLRKFFQPLREEADSLLLKLESPRKTWVQSKIQSSIPRPFITGSPTQWEGGSYFLRMSLVTHSPNETQYETTIHSSSETGTTEVPLREVIESRIPAKCKIFITGLNLQDFYSLLSAPTHTMTQRSSAPWESAYKMKPEMRQDPPEENKEITPLSSSRKISTPAIEP